MVIECDTVPHRPYAILLSGECCKEEDILWNESQNAET